MVQVAILLVESLFFITCRKEQRYTARAPVERHTQQSSRAMHRATHDETCVLGAVLQPELEPSIDKDSGVDKENGEEGKQKTKTDQCRLLVREPQSACSSTSSTSSGNIVKGRDPCSWGSGGEATRCPHQRPQVSQLSRKHFEVRPKNWGWMPQQ